MSLRASVGSTAPDDVGGAQGHPRGPGDAYIQISLDSKSEPVGMLVSDVNKGKGSGGEPGGPLPRKPEDREDGKQAHPDHRQGHPLP